MTSADLIDRVILTHIRIPFKEPFRISGLEVPVRDALLVEVETGSGIGLGEGAPLAGLSGAGPDPVEAAWSDLVERIAPALPGRRLGTVEDIEEVAGDWNVNSFAAAAAETALWDLVGQLRHASIAELLGATELRVNMGIEAGLAVGLHSSIVELIRSIESHLEAGYHRVKIEIRPGQDVELVRAVRQHFGDVPLMVDACGSYTKGDLDVFRELDEYDLLMIEQPMAPDDLDGLAELQGAIMTPVCLDETANCLERTAEAIRRNAGRIVNLKLQRLGGHGPARAVHDLCYQHGWQCWVGSMPELGIGQAHSIHLATLPNCKYPADLEPSACWFVDDYTVPTVELNETGMITVPTRPGLGYHVDPVKVRRYQVRRQEFTRSSEG